MISKQPKVSILCLAYRHQAYIVQALEGFLLQETDFPFEVLIGDDASDDDTPAIIQSYVERHPDIIKPVMHKTNRGAAGNLSSLVERIEGEYVAICDGDDFWTDPSKLQKQVNFLEKDSSYTVCFHKVVQHFEDKSQPDSFIDPKALLPDVASSRDYFVLGDLLRMNVIPSLSAMYRWKLGNQMPIWMLDYSICDLPLHLIHADGGKICYIDEVMGTYRRHSDGAWWNNHTVEHRKAHLRKYISLLQSTYQYLNGRHSQSFEETIALCEEEWRRLASPLSGWKRYLKRVLK